ncbi:aromatic amino acid ammonia-lyase [Sporolactobacillus shoreicorticis]|uniref:Histidine ammonia-lyase n=1 Tax=Sporolactobacillus shoreicorticis TaxID=1923877 RepID=A0ABW5S566_9BACL|nr:aromatic amino acid ammonia-lyase [Sporolactobacillus shoreicorticis]MCO7124291.1 aromatic amino acid ammonia-lyase [Sporolactobacillus shoreicorticis]
MKTHEIVLDGQRLTIKDIIRVARKKDKIIIADHAMDKVVAGRQFIEQQVYSEIPVYGLNRGVGQNKDQHVSPEQYERYNHSLLLSHCISVGPEASEETVRAAILIRLNTLLLGYTGVQPEIVRMYQAFLNAEISPIVYERGSVGAADIGCLASIGLALIGEGEVRYKGVRMAAAEALEKCGLKKIRLGPKDGLAIVSSNALFIAKTVLFIQQVEVFLNLANLIYAMSLEGFDGNVTPLNRSVVDAKKAEGQKKTAAAVRKYLESSYLWDGHKRKNLQDPLSFRGAFSVHGSVRDSLDYLKNQVSIYLNASEDNPAVLVNEKEIISCANYEITTLVLGIEMINLALCHMARIACFRIIKLGNPEFTGLPRFLAPKDKSVLGFATIQKTIAALEAEIQDLCRPVSTNFFPLAGDIEDHATNSVYAVQKSEKIMDNLYYIFGIETMHAAQAIDLRGNILLGKGTKQLYQSMRCRIAFLDQDRNLSIDIEKAYKLLKDNVMSSNNVYF